MRLMRGPWLVLLVAAAAAGYLAGARGAEGSGTRRARERERTPGSDVAVPSRDPHPAREIGAVEDPLATTKPEAPAPAREQDVAIPEVILEGRADGLAAPGEEDRRRAVLEDRKRGGTLGLLRGLSQLPVHLPDLVADDEAFAALFERHSEGPTVTAMEWLERSFSLRDGATLSLNAGPIVGWPPYERWPRDLAIQGAGMDATLLKLPEHFRTPDEIWNLTLRDLTLTSIAGALVGADRPPASIRLERCRVIGFRPVFLDGSAVLHARDTRFESTKATDKIFDLRAGLVRLDDCIFQGPFGSILEPHPGVTYLFRRCTFLDTPDTQAVRFSSPAPGVRFEKCESTYMSAEAVSRWSGHGIRDLKPGWR